MKTILLSAMLCLAQLAYGQLDLDVTINSTIGCPNDLEISVGYGIPGGPTPSAVSFGCYAISSLPTTINVCPTCSLGEVVWFVIVTDCSNSSNTTTVGDSNLGTYSRTGTMPGPVWCGTSANNVTFTQATTIPPANASIDIQP